MNKGRIKMYYYENSRIYMLKTLKNKILIILKPTSVDHAVFNNPSRDMQFFNNPSRDMQYSLTL